MTDRAVSIACPVKPPSPPSNRRREAFRGAAGFRNGGLEDRSLEVQAILLGCMGVGRWYCDHQKTERVPGCSEEESLMLVGD
ncbi:MAG: hypothetical protein HN406_35810 [Lentisphaerae bacterium]|nr:hypothetical protein [Lentisphaerota bacterium]